MNRIGKKIAWMSLSGMMIFSLSACGKKDNAADETLIDPDYIVQEYETTTTDEGYTIINGFYRIKSNNGDKDTILYIPYIENKQQGVSYQNRRQKGGLTLKRGIHQMAHYIISRQAVIMEHHM